MFDDEGVHDRPGCIDELNRVPERFTRRLEPGLQPVQSAGKTPAKHPSTSVRSRAQASHRRSIAFVSDSQNCLAFLGNQSDRCRQRGNHRQRRKHDLDDYTRKRHLHGSGRREQPKATKKANRAPRRAPVAPKKAKAGKKASPAKKAPTGAKKATPARDGSKASKILELLKRPGGATAKELIKATGWQPHSLRGFISGTLRKKMGLAVTSAKGEDGEHSYSVKA